jgi:hypothetical protein
MHAKTATGGERNGFFRRESTKIYDYIYLYRFICRCDFHVLTNLVRPLQAARAQTQAWCSARRRQQRWRGSCAQTHPGPQAMIRLCVCMRVLLSVCSARHRVIVCDVCQWALPAQVGPVL